MKRISILLIVSIFLTGLFSIQVVFADDFLEDEPFEGSLLNEESQVFTPRLPKVEAVAAIVMDMKSGRVLYEKNAYSRRPMASTTKIMTAVVALENGNLEDNVTVSKRAAAIGGSTIKLKAGETLKLRELMYGLMLKSGNDAALAIAEHIGGTVENFVEMMNRKALELGAKDTHFQTPHGLDRSEHYSTAYDLALITKYALVNPTFSKIVGTKSAYIPNRDLNNTNEMLGLYPGADGVKTGFTGQAGRCLVTSATRNNWRVISVVLNCATRTKRAQSSKAILDYAFDNYKRYRLLKQGQEIIKIPVIKGVAKSVSIKAVDDISMPLRQDEVDTLETQVEMEESLAAPVQAGVKVGTIKYFSNGKEIAQSRLETGEEIQRKGVFDYMIQILYRWEKLMRFEG
ncbi:MAG: D-alanyl-D-alanine carboxypeptidase [Clostridia bacterium]|nr:D-alanyl-D-alanine carboxypeptidase [Clostridia bacterium]